MLLLPEYTPRKIAAGAFSIAVVVFVYASWVWDFPFGRPAHEKFELYEAVFEKFESGDVKGAIEDADRVISLTRKSHSAEASRALTLLAAIREHEFLDHQDLQSAKIAYLDAISLDHKNGIALGHYSVGKLAKKYGAFNEIDVQDDLRKASEIGDPWAAYKFAQWITARTSGIASGIPKYYRRSIDLGYTHLEAAFVLFDVVLQHRGSREDAFTMFWEERESGSPYVYGGLYRASPSDKLRVPVQTLDLKWAYTAAIAAGRSDLRELTEIGGIAVDWLYNEPVRRAYREARRDEARKWVHELVARGAGRWAQIALSCKKIQAVSHQVYARCVELMPSAADSCISLSLWRPLKEFEKTPLFAKCLNEFPNHLEKLYSTDPNNRIFTLE